MTLVEVAVPEDLATALIDSGAAKKPQVVKAPAKAGVKSNPLGLEIGQSVKVKAVSTVGYGGSDSRERVVHRVEYGYPQVMWVVGNVAKAVGRRSRGNLEDSASFSASGYIRFYQCRTKMYGKPFLVAPADIVTEEADATPTS